MQQPRTALELAPKGLEVIGVIRPIRSCKDVVSVTSSAEMNSNGWIQGDDSRASAFVAPP